MNESAPNRIKELRKKRGWSQDVLGSMIGTSNQQIGYLERGERRLSDPWISKLADAFGISAGELFNDSGNEVAHVSWVQAGAFAETADPYVPEGTPMIAVAGLKHPNHIALTVAGDSMNKIAPEGSIIIVDFTDRELRPGKDYVFRDGGTATFKRWRAEPARLEPFSTVDHDTIFPDGDVEVVGRVVKVIVDL
jgi:SOS-response transcriptional repressor LexA